MNKLEHIVTLMSMCESDINEHIGTLIKYGSECNKITEMGTRWLCSTWAFLGCAPESGLISYDMRDPSNWSDNPAVINRGWNKLQDVYDVAEEFGLKFKFIQANVLEVEIEQTDLLFLDTWHSYRQLKAELALHSEKVNKYIILHDTTTYATKDETNYEELGPKWKANADEKQGIWPAVEEFLEQNPSWFVKEKFENCSGLTILAKKNRIKVTEIDEEV